VKVKMAAWAKDEFTLAGGAKVFAQVPIVVSKGS
jgi:hypothetical protein